MHWEVLEFAGLREPLSFAQCAESVAAGERFEDLLCRASIDQDDPVRRSDATDEVAKHLSRHLEVRDHTVAERAKRPNLRRRPADHAPRLFTDRLNPAALLIDGDDR